MSYSVCPFYNIENEYRVIILNNEIRLIYKKILPIVCGDGESTVKELLKKFNYVFLKIIVLLMKILYYQEMKSINMVGNLIYQMVAKLRL